MANFVALEAHFLIAFKRLMGVFTAQNAVHPLCIIWTLSSHVTELLAVVALHCNVLLSPIPYPFDLLKLVKFRLLAILVLLFSSWLWLRQFALLWRFLSLIGNYLLRLIHKVLVTPNKSLRFSKRASNDQIRVVACTYSG